MEKIKTYLAGLDVGSTTVKIVVIDENYEVVYSTYERHNTNQPGTALKVLEEVHKKLGDVNLKIAVCGSGGYPIANAIGVNFIQEVAACASAVKKLYPKVRTVIELGGQDAKIVLFSGQTEGSPFSDMKMNGACAGGTGAFIDQVAELLKIKSEEYDELAAQGTHVYDISGRCGVFAKTDIQPLLNQGANKGDIALSGLHALVKQTIGGLAQGVTLHAPVMFLGGPLTFNKTLQNVFKDRLELNEDEAILPENAEIFIAQSTAIAQTILFKNAETSLDWNTFSDNLKAYITKSKSGVTGKTELFFDTKEIQDEFTKRHHIDESTIIKEPKEGETLRCHLGIDAGSTTSKFILLGQDDNIYYTFYNSNAGDPIKTIKDGIMQMYEHFEKKNIKLKILGAGSTGYGEELIKRGFNLDYSIVETVAHAEAARHFVPDASFIIDIGGQDMKAIKLKDGTITDIVLNEACSAGCGSFLETYANSLGIKTQDVAKYAFDAGNISKLGSRCTVFMNSSIITEQKNGRSTGDILAGLCRSVVENVFTKVVRVSNTENLGNKIVVQGGTFKNDAVLRAFEQYVGKNVFRPAIPGLMGAYGIALLTRQHMKLMNQEKSSFLSLAELEKFEYHTQSAVVCGICSNNCKRSIVKFSTGSILVTGHRCDKGDLSLDKNERSKKARNLIKHHKNLLLREYNQGKPAKINTTIGIPLVLEFWESLPFWKTLFKAAGFDVVTSGLSSYEMYDAGLKYIPSDTACFPAKLVHGHIETLLDNDDVDVIFMPMLIGSTNKDKNALVANNCSIIQGYPNVIQVANEPTKRKKEKQFEYPTFLWYSDKVKEKKIVEYLENRFGINKKVAKTAYKYAAEAAEEFNQKFISEGKRIIESVTESNSFACVIIGRFYHSDPLVNHEIGDIFTNKGIPVIPIGALDLSEMDVSDTRMEDIIPYHTKVVKAALYVAKNPHLQLVQLTSFGCGHDAAITEEVQRVLQEHSNKELLLLKIDESDTKGPIKIRVNSFLETVATKYKMHLEKVPLTVEEQAISDKNKSDIAAKQLYTKKDRTEKTIYVPNLSETFNKFFVGIYKGKNIKMVPMPLADEKAISLGKRYTHNDICYPAQINIGEMLTLLSGGEVNPDNVALILSKNCENCRAVHYPMLARKAMDDAGYPQVPIVTTGVDTKGTHPGYSFSTSDRMLIGYGIICGDALEAMRMRIRPYEIIKGETDEVYEKAVNYLVDTISLGKKKLMKAFVEVVDRFNAIEIDENIPRRPRVMLIGEILMNHHPTSNLNMIRYLENNGMEVVLPSMFNFFWVAPLVNKALTKDGFLDGGILNRLKTSIEIGYFRTLNKKINTRLTMFRHPTQITGVEELIPMASKYIDVKYTAGEGWLLPTEIDHAAQHGVNSFVVLQPFGCIPNHITGRGMTKELKKNYPNIQIAPLDFDPDTSTSNIENRLQMLIMAAKSIHQDLETLVEA